MKITRELLFELYWKKGFIHSIEQISRKIGFSRHMTDKFMRDFKIPIRSSGETNMLLSMQTKNDLFKYSQTYEYLSEKYGV